MTAPQPVTPTELTAYLAGDLDWQQRAALADRIAADHEAQALLADWRAQDAAIRRLYAPAADEPVPERLRAVVRSAASAAPHAARPAVGAVLRPASVLALLMVGAVAGWGVTTLTTPVSAPATIAVAGLAQTAELAHATYVVEVAHPVEVPASDGAHLSAWLSKRVGQTLTPPDFADLGFDLIGGRVVPFGARPAALLLYQDRQGKRVTLLLAAVPDEAQGAFRFTDAGAARSVVWAQGALGGVVTGDLPRDALQSLARSAHDHLADAT